MNVWNFKTLNGTLHHFKPEPEMKAPFDKSFLVCIPGIIKVTAGLLEYIIIMVCWKESEISNAPMQLHYLSVSWLNLFLCQKQW